MMADGCTQDLQDAVSDEVAVPVIVLLEKVDVEHDQTELGSAGRRLLGLFSKYFQKIAMVEDPGQAVEAGLLLHLGVAEAVVEGQRDMLGQVGKQLEIGTIEGIGTVGAQRNDPGDMGCLERHTHPGEAGLASANNKVIHPIQLRILAQVGQEKLPVVLDHPTRKCAFQRDADIVEILTIIIKQVKMDLPANDCANKVRIGFERLLQGSIQQGDRLVSFKRKHDLAADLIDRFKTVNMLPGRILDPDDGFDHDNSHDIRCRPFQKWLQAGHGTSAQQGTYAGGQDHCQVGVKTARGD